MKNTPFCNQPACRLSLGFLKWFVILLQLLLTGPSAPLSRFFLVRWQQRTVCNETRCHLSLRAWQRGRSALLCGKGLSSEAQPTVSLWLSGGRSPLQVQPLSALAGFFPRPVRNTGQQNCWACYNMSFDRGPNQLHPTLTGERRGQEKACHAPTQMECNQRFDLLNILWTLMQEAMP